MHNHPDARGTERARRLLALEGAAGSAAECAAAAGQVYDKLQARMAPLVGVAGVHLLLVRSARLTEGEFAFLAGVADLEGSAKLRESLQGQEPALAREAAAALFGTFFALITTFIGERLTTQLLRSTWPTIEEAAPRETNK